LAPNRELVVVGKVGLTVGVDALDVLEDFVWKARKVREGDAGFGDGVTERIELGVELDVPSIVQI
jgi:hypothetical protein